MKLRELNIELMQWGANEGKYVGKIKYEGEAGAVEMRLSPNVSEAVLVCIGETITQFATAAAAKVSDSIASSVEEAKHKQIEA